MALLPNAIEIGAYPFKLRARAQPRLVWVRGFHRIYNPELAAEVMALLVREFPGAHLTMVGPDKGDGSLEATQRLAAKLGIRGKVTFPGGVPKAEVPNWISRGDVFINTTSVDNTPVSVLEAMACGLCIVSTDVGGLPYLLESGQDALLVPPDDPQAMASAVRRLLTDHYLAARLSYNAHKKATQFDWSMILPYWEALLTAVADNDGGVRSQAGARW
jgi:glycosyltransferase involved in cell wall biosynthesis